MRFTIPAIALLLLISVTGCRDAGEFLAWNGSPQGEDGWSEDYAAAPADVWEALRIVVRDNGSIKEEKPDEMFIRGEYRPSDSSEWDGIEMKGQVYDKSEDGKLQTRLIVHAWYANNANDRGRQSTAREYCNTVFRVLKAWQGEEPDEDSSVTTTSEDPVKEDEAIAFFKVKPEQAYAATLKVLKLYGKIEQEDPNGGFIRASKENALESTKDEVRVNIYDRTEEEGPRCKLSVRVRRGEDNKPLQDVAKSYVNEVRKELEKQFGPQE
ncbi:MAG: hypothetical protein K8I27_15315 [Planctomycetes bacterium]|nr:hypothetical protein [Planctomycetota bacterium]